jgi:hypothetical protein
MLETLEQVEWANLEHAYGSAADLPEKIRALTSNDPQARAWARDMLEMGPFHQGNIYSSTPYVARFLVELAQEEDVPGREGIFSYLSRLMQTALRILASPAERPDDDMVEDDTGKTLGERRRQARDIARQIRDEIYVQPDLDLFYVGLSDYDPNVRLSVIRLLLTTYEEGLNTHIAFSERFDRERDADVRAVLAYCIGATEFIFHRDYMAWILENEQETKLVRLAAGFGWVASWGAQTPEDGLARLAGFMYGSRDVLRRLEYLFNRWLQSPRCPHLLDALYSLSPEQKLRFVPPLLDIYRQLPNAKESPVYIGESYYFTALVRLAFPEPVSAEVTFHALNEMQKAVLTTFQTYQLSDEIWHDWANPNDFQNLTGLELERAADFGEFLEGKRAARRAGSGFDSYVAYWRKYRQRRRVM